MNAAQELPDLTGFSKNQTAKALDLAGFEFHHTTAGSYMKFYHEDGSQIWIRPDGEVVRLGPKIKSREGKSYRPRYDQDGNRTQSHSTGEVIDP